MHHISVSIIAKELLLKLPTDSMRLFTVETIVPTQQFTLDLDTFSTMYLSPIVKTLTTVVDCNKPISYYSLSIPPGISGAVELIPFRNAYRCVRVLNRPGSDYWKLEVTYDIIEILFTSKVQNSVKGFWQELRKLMAKYGEV